MNIFAIEGDETTGEINWYESGRSQDNLRTVKMLLESTQLLSTALQLNGMPGPYKPNHAKHPSTIWTAESSANWGALMVHALALNEEYEERFKKKHKCYDRLIEMCGTYDAKKFSNVNPTPLRLAMPDEFKSNNPVKSYRDYYSTKEKMRYPKNKIPDWFAARRKIPFIIV
jgi:hypothetical protein